jgi:hypothetical protein
VGVNLLVWACVRVYLVVHTTKQTSHSWSTARALASAPGQVCPSFDVVGVCAGVFFV